MKLGILTQSMSANYGCNLQMYALQTILQRMGHDVEILDIKVPQLKASFSVRIIEGIISFIKKKSQGTRVRGQVPEPSIYN